ncbi:MAG: cardiolipin synthase B [Gemmatimonadales bacterium]|nr:cardiolipin synthase B [Gemmatimonadales bacterium]
MHAHPEPQYIPVVWITVAIVVGAVGVLIALNLSTSERKIVRQVRSLYRAGDPQFVRSMGALLGPSIVQGNTVDALYNGDQIFPAMLSAIRSARVSITFETYIYWSGRIGRDFAEALGERAGAGVRVHVLLDWLGSGKMDEDVLDRMEAAGVEICRYHPLKWHTIGRLNNRTHRKLLVVDGVVGFTGGVGIADNWLGNAGDPDHWRDSHFRITGPAVAQMQATFMDNWMKCRELVLHGVEYFPPLPASGEMAAQMFSSSPGAGSESVRLMYLLSIASAQESIRIANAYFVPDTLSVEELVTARRRGVQVEIITPGRHIDTGIVRKASRSRWGPLLEAGVEIYEYAPTMYHCKVMIVDDVWVSVGSTNFDNRSFRLNDEANLNILHADFARAQADAFEADKRQSRRITLDAWRRRPFSERMLERLAGTLRGQL